MKYQETKFDGRNIHVLYEVVMVGVDASSPGQHVLSHDTSKLKLCHQWTAHILVVLSNNILYVCIYCIIINKTANK